MINTSGTPPTEAAVAAAWRRVFLFALKCDGQQENLKAIYSLRDDLQELLIIIHKMALQELSKKFNQSHISGQSTPRSIDSGHELDSFRTPPSSPGSCFKDGCVSRLQAQLEEANSKNAVLMRNLEMSNETDELRKKEEELKKKEYDLKKQEEHLAALSQSMQKNEEHFNTLSESIKRTQKENADLREKLAYQENVSKCSSKEAAGPSKEIGAIARVLQELQQENAEMKEKLDSPSSTRAPLRTSTCQNSTDRLDTKKQTCRKGAVFRGKALAQCQVAPAKSEAVPKAAKQEPSSRSPGEDRSHAEAVEAQVPQQVDVTATSSQDSSGFSPEKSLSDGGCSPKRSPQSEVKCRRSSTGTTTTKERKRRSGGKQRRPRAIAAQGKVLTVPETGKGSDCNQQ